MKHNKTLKVFAIVFTVLLMVFSIISDLSAQPPQKGKLLRRALPDLIVRDIRLVNGCQIQVTIANIGKQGVPASFYNLPKAVGVQMYNNGKPWGGLILSGFDPAGNLKKPGGIATHIWFPNAANLKLTPGIHSIKVVVDHGKVMAEARENNNSLTRRVKCGGSVIGTPRPVATGTIVAPLAKPPQRFFLDFSDAYLSFRMNTQSIQIIAEKNVLSYGSDWEKCQLKPYLFHIRNKVWKDFYWQVNTSKKEVYKVTGGTFCKIGGNKQKLPYNVTTSGDFCRIYLTKAYLVYVPASKTIQIASELMVLSYGGDWEKCNKAANTYHLRENFWQNFYWMVDTFKKKVFRIKGGTFCGSGGSSQLLGSINVRVVK